MEKYSWLQMASATKGAIPPASPEEAARIKAEVDEWCAKNGLRVPMAEPTEDEKRALDASVKAAREAKAKTEVVWKPGDRVIAIYDDSIPAFWKSHKEGLGQCKVGVDSHIATGAGAIEKFSGVACAAVSSVGSKASGNYWPITHLRKPEN